MKQILNIETCLKSDPVYINMATQSQLRNITESASHLSGSCAMPSALLVNSRSPQMSRFRLNFNLYSYSFTFSLSYLSRCKADITESQQKDARIWRALCVCAIVLFQFFRRMRTKSHFAVILELEADGQTYVLFTSCSHFERKRERERGTCTKTLLWGVETLFWSLFLAEWITFPAHFDGCCGDGGGDDGVDHDGDVYICLLALKLTPHEYTRLFQPTNRHTQIDNSSLASRWHTAKLKRILYA